MKDTKENRGWLSSIGNGIGEVFGGGDKSKSDKNSELEDLVKSLETKPETLSSVYKTVMGVDLDSTKVNSISESNALASNLSSEQNIAVQNLLEEQYSDLEKQFEDTKDKNGWISGTWDKYSMPKCQDIFLRGCLAFTSLHLQIREICLAGYCTPCLKIQPF